MKKCSALMGVRLVLAEGCGGAIGQLGGRDGNAAGCRRPDDNFVRPLQSAFAAACDLHGEGVGSCGLRRSRQV